MASESVRKGVLSTVEARIAAGALAAIAVHLALRFGWAAAAKARAMPVFPLVASRMARPGFRSPRFSASHTMDAPIRHLTE